MPPSSRSGTEPVGCGAALGRGCWADDRPCVKRTVSVPATRSPRGQRSVRLLARVAYLVLLPSGRMDGPEKSLRLHKAWHPAWGLAGKVGDRAGKWAVRSPARSHGMRWRPALCSRSIAQRALSTWPITMPQRWNLRRATCSCGLRRPAAPLPRRMRFSAQAGCRLFIRAGQSYGPDLRHAQRPDVSRPCGAGRQGFSQPSY